MPIFGEQRTLVSPGSALFHYRSYRTLTVDTYRDNSHLKTIIQLTARCGIRSNHNLIAIKGLSGIQITVIGACHYAPFYGACH